MKAEYANCVRAHVGLEHVIVEFLQKRFDGTFIEISALAVPHTEWQTIVAFVNAKVLERLSMPDARKAPGREE